MLNQGKSEGVEIRVWNGWGNGDAIINGVCTRNGCLFCWFRNGHVQVKAAANF